MVKIKKKIAEKVFHKKSENAKKSINPFEVHINKQKYQVLGQKLKHDRGLPGVSRAKAIQKRKHTLLPEYNVKHKSNKFVDRRIGEKSFSMTEEDRTMARFTAERMKHHNRKSIYNLADDEILTHRGQTLSEIEKFDDPRSDDDDDEDEEGRKSSGKLDDNFVGDAHFGGGVLTKTGKEGAKSHKDLIDQLIAESKKRKAEKQKTKEETLELTEKLDSDWKDLLPLVSKSKKSNDDKPEVHQKPDDYDKVMRELKFEARGNPTDRLKSEDEIAREEKERLEKLEQDRLNRMMGITEKPTDKPQHRSADDLDDNFNYDSDPEETLAYDEEGKLKNAVCQETDTNDTNAGNNKQSDHEDDEDDEDDMEEESSEAETEDDLSDLKESESDSDEEEQTKKNHDKKENIKKIEINEDKIVERKRKLSETLSDKSNKKVQKPETLSDKSITKVQMNETLFDEPTKNIQETENQSEIMEEKSKTDKSSKKVKKTETLSEKSITKVQMSETLFDESTKNIQETENQSEIMEDKSKIDLVLQNEIIEKAKKELPYTYSLPESYESLQSILNNQSPEYQNVIIERMIKCNHPSLAEENKENLGRLFVYLLQHLNDMAPDKNFDNADNFKACFAVLNSLTPHLYTLTQLNPQNAKDSLIEVIKEKQNDYRIKQKIYPGIDVLIYLKLISCLFSTSDFRHQVVTPAFVFISQMLTNCKVKTRYDVAYGLFLVTLFVEYTTLSKRYLPAVIIYLTGVLHMAVPKIGVRVIKINPPFKSNSTALVLVEPCKKCKFDLKMTAQDFVDTEFDTVFKIKSLHLTLKLCEELQENWKTLSSDINIFEPFYELLDKLPKSNYPKNIREQIAKMINNNEDTKKNKKLSYIVMERKKPKALRLYEPNIQQVFEFRRGKPMSRERAEREKLMYRYKKETKGALREIRRDKSFLGRVKIKQQMQSDYDRREKVKRIYAEASMQQSELNAMDRQKKRK